MAIIRFKKRYTELLSGALERFCTEHPEFKDSKITYAGRLDPMAEGELLLLTDEDVHSKELYLGRDKVYEVTAVLGIHSDTYDILGLPVYVSCDAIVSEDIEKILESQLELSTQKYPIYSSKPVQGKPLFKWAQEGLIDSIEIPSRSVSIYSTELLNLQAVRGADFVEAVVKSISQVEGDFRQNHIIKSWEEMAIPETLQLVRIRYHVSSGTYIRALIHDLGRGLGTGALSVKINRTEICSPREAL